MEHISRHWHSTLTLPIKAYIHARTHFHVKRIFFQCEAWIRENKKNGSFFRQKSATFWKMVMVLFVSAFFHPGVHLVIRRYEKYGVNRKISWVWNNYSRFHKTTYFVLRNDKNAFCLKKRGVGVLKLEISDFCWKGVIFFSFRIHEKGCFLNFWMDVRFGLEVGGEGGGGGGIVQKVGTIFHERKDTFSLLVNTTDDDDTRHWLLISREHTDLKHAKMLGIIYHEVFPVPAESVYLFSLRTTVTCHHEPRPLASFWGGADGANDCRENACMGKNSSR